MSSSTSETPQQVVPVAAHVQEHIGWYFARTVSLTRPNGPNFIPAGAKQASFCQHLIPLAANQLPDWARGQACQTAAAAQQLVGHDVSCGDA